MNRNPTRQPRGRSEKIGDPAAGRLMLLGVRLSLLVAAFSVLAIGFLRLPEIAVTQGELVIGELIAMSVGLQLLVAAFFFQQPAGEPRRVNFLRVRRDG